MADASVLFAAAQALFREGRGAEARERALRALAAAPRQGAIHTLLGLIAYQCGDTAEAANRFGTAAMLALADGDSDTALQRAVHAVTVQETAATRRLFADIAGTLRFSGDDPVLRALLIRALREEWGPAQALAYAALGLVRARLAQGLPVEDDDLLRAILPVAPIADTSLETALTQARRRFSNDAGNEAFAVALAQQCFLNGYVFWQTEEETAQVAALRARMETRLAAGESVADADVAMLACYLPLGELAGVQAIAASETIAPLLQQQRDEPAREQRIASALSALTPLQMPGDDGAPWPRWRDLPQAADAGGGWTPVTLRAYLASRFPDAALDIVPERPDLLVAGCGTGQYALYLSRTLSLGAATAIDLSRANLAYAARKAEDVGLPLRFGQGDILEIAALEQKFGLIECGGVLHQLPDPLAGWSALRAVLQPGGVMRIAVHSAVAQATFDDVRARIAQQGFSNTPQGIRAVRWWLKQQNDEPAILGAPAFFTDGGCRHLLFAQEQPLSFAQIAGFLAEHKLVLLGLDVAANVAAAYRARFPGDLTATDLDNWAAFEQDNPQTFTAMIQFWVRG